MSSSADTQTLSTQVGGHVNGVATTDDNSLLIKAALPVELKFYQTMASAAEPQYDALRPFIPKFIGTLSLQGELDTDKPPTEGSINVKPIEIDGEKKDEFSPQSIVLENLSYLFLKPNILDVKLGTVLYDDSAPPDKVARMIKKAETTTTGKTGIQLTGFQVYNNSTNEAVHTSKAYGKSISPKQLPEGIARFFPIATKEAPEQGLPASLLLQILELLREDVADIRDAFAALEMRMVGGSLLILYESDPACAEEGLKSLKDEDEEEDEDEDEDEDDEDENNPNKLAKPHPPYDVRLIDFAHTRFVPGEGPDQGVLLGFKTLLGLLDERIAAVRTCV
ncbi:kinase [Favolaschia claudopus]|uniref:Kinase n=1 Tax=Favolaschia claudopus TaxID=2862362 RepID=A0AAW0CH20_9AGAR